jgi:hypothetical protein
LKKGGEFRQNPCPSGIKFGTGYLKKLKGVSVLVIKKVFPGSWVVIYR